MANIISRHQKLYDTNFLSGLTATTVNTAATQASVQKDMLIDPYVAEDEDDEEEEEEGETLEEDEQNNHDGDDESPDDETMAFNDESAGRDQTMGIEQLSTMNNHNNINGHNTTDLVESSASAFDASTRMLLEFFVSTGQPLSVFNNFRLRAFLLDLNPAYVLPSSSTVEFDYLPELVHIMEDDVRQEMACAEHVAITLSNLKTNESNLDYTRTLTLLSFFFFNQIFSND